MIPHTLWTAGGNPLLDGSISPSPKFDERFASLHGFTSRGPGRAHGSCAGAPVTQWPQDCQAGSSRQAGGSPRMTLNPPKPWPARRPSGPAVPTRSGPNHAGFRVGRAAAIQVKLSGQCHWHGHGHGHCGIRRVWAVCGRGRGTSCLKSVQRLSRSRCVRPPAAPY